MALNEGDIRDPRAVCSENLGRLAIAHAEISERRICEISERARLAVEEVLPLVYGELDAYGILTLISEVITEDEPVIHGDAIPENGARLVGFARQLSRCDRAVLCELLLARLTDSGLPLSERDFLQESWGDETVVYVKNPYADEAYDVFSQELFDPRVKYAPSFKDAVRAVNDGEVRYCLLPLEERGGVRLPTVTELIYKNELKIDSVTPVFGFDGTADMRYALLSKGFSVPEANAEDDRYLEVRIDGYSDPSLAELLSVAEFYGVALYRVSTVVIDTEDGRQTYYSVVLRDNGRDFTPLLTYLTLFTDGFVPVGMYKNLE